MSSLLTAPIQAQVDNYLAQSEFAQAATLLGEQVPAPLPPTLYPQLTVLLARFPHALRKAHPALLYLHGLLLAARNAELQAMLTTAHQREKPNPVLTAVFGLYLHGATVKEIAVQLQRAPSSIRNYVTTIYQIFGLTVEDYKSLPERRMQLEALARKRGLSA